MDKDQSIFNPVNLLLLLVSTIVSFAVLECGLRLYFHGSIFWEPRLIELRKPHPERGWTLAPDLKTLWSDRDYYLIVTTNSKGLRDVEHEYVAKSGTVRVLVLGDSFMEALQVDLSKSMPRVSWRNGLLIEELR
ncbi:hypothetical protein ACFL2Q_15885 [Thermodesulfobacteriota bacterium]